MPLTKLHRAVRAALGVIGLMLSVAAGATQRPGAVAQEPKRGAVIAGRVINAATGAPVPGAVVTGQWGEGRASFLTGPDGRFIVAEVPPGPMSLDAAKTGYFPGHYRRTDFNGPAEPLQVPNGANIDNIVLQMRPSATISGVVTDASGVPASGIGVMVLSADQNGRNVVVRQASSSVTDAVGRYAVGDLDAGTYRVLVPDRDRSPETADPFSDALSVWVSAGDDRTNVDLRLRRVVPRRTRGCAISGRILDEYGDPRSAVVRAAEYVPTGQEPVPWRTANTDAKGRYCLSDLMPGEYLLNATTEILPGGLQTLNASGRVHTIALPTIYYPDATTSARASLVAVGSEATAIDFVIRAIPATTVTVRVQPALVPRLSIAPSEDRYGFEGLLLPVQRGFQANNIVAGRYRILASTTNVLDSRLIASVEVESDGVTPIERTIVLEPGARLSGRLTFEGASAPPSPPLIWLEPAAPVHVGAELLRGAVSFDDGGRFVVEGVMPGQYVIHAADQNERASQQWSLAAATLNGRDVLDLPVEVAARHDVSGLLLTLTDRLTELSGTLRDQNSQPISRGTVAVFATDRRYWRIDSRRIRLTRLDQGGRYAVRGLPPGDYHVAVILHERLKDLESDLSQLLPFAVPVSLAAAERKALDLRARTAPDAQ